MKHNQRQCPWASSSEDSSRRGNERGSRQACLEVGGQAVLQLQQQQVPFGLQHHDVCVVVVQDHVLLQQQQQQQAQSATTSQM